MRDLKLASEENSFVLFLKHPVDGKTDEMLCYSMNTELICKFKSFNISTDFDISESQTALTSLIFL